MYFTQSLEEMQAAMQKHIDNREKNFSWRIEDFELVGSLGLGQFGRVQLALEKRSGYVVALKSLSKQQLVRSRMEKQLVREIEIHSHLQHRNILQMLTYFHDRRRVYLVLEYAQGGDVFDELRKQKQFPENLAAKYTYQIADALEYCHQNKVIHRDIKPSNLLLTDAGDVKLADFGWSVHAARRKTRCGTMYYMPPEIIGNQMYDYRVDNWALGILVYEFLVGWPPFFPSGPPEVYRMIKNVEVPWDKLEQPKARDLVSKLVKKKAKDRLELSNVMKHAWVVENKDK